jgi:hypothetical protein
VHQTFFEHFLLFGRKKGFIGISAFYFRRCILERESERERERMVEKKILNPQQESFSGACCCCGKSFDFRCKYKLVYPQQPLLKGYRLLRAGNYVRKLSLMRANGEIQNIFFLPTETTVFSHCFQIVRC